MNSGGGVDSIPEKYFVITLSKGGIGKTTTMLNLGTTLFLRNKKVCVMAKNGVIIRRKFSLKMAPARTDSNEPKEVETPGQEEEILIDEGTGTRLIKQTIRGGQKSNYPGDIVIIGDVNPGGEIEAAGDILIFGKLRGAAHAGINGDTSAKIVAVELTPLQIRIAGINRRSPDSVSDPGHAPEVAKIKNGNIVIESLYKSRKED